MHLYVNSIHKLYAGGGECLLTNCLGDAYEPIPPEIVAGKGGDFGEAGEGDYWPANYYASVTQNVELTPGAGGLAVNTNGFDFVLAENLGDIRGAIDA